MPAKPCPSCGLKNPASATRCDCGHRFGGFAGHELGLVVARGQLTCPQCGWINGHSAMECRCGHSFAEARQEERDVLTQHLTTSWFAIVGGIVLVIGGLGLAALQIMLGAGRILVPTGLVLGGLGVMARGAGGVTQARLRLDALGARPIEPPRARMLKK